MNYFLSLSTSRAISTSSLVGTLTTKILESSDETIASLRVLLRSGSILAPKNDKPSITA